MGNFTDHILKSINKIDMKKNIFLSIFVLGLTFISCRRHFTDTIMLSGHQYNLKANGDSVFVTSKGIWWWFADVILDSTHYYMPQTNNKCKLLYSDSNFQIERRSCDTLFVKMNINKTNSSRKLWIQLESGDYFDSILFTQNKK